MTRAEEAAIKAYPDYWKCYPFETNKEARAAFIKGYEQAEQDLGWHSVEESLPEMDEEVIVLLAEWNRVRVEPLYRVSFGHIVNKEYCQDYNGWNIPGVKFWMPMPKIPEE